MRTWPRGYSNDMVARGDKTGRKEMRIDKYTLMRDEPRWLDGVRCWVAHVLTRGYIVSYPKSGRTWLRMLLASYFAERYGVDLTPEITDQWRQDRRIPVIRFVHLGSDGTDRLENTFEFGLYRRKRIVYLIRDPRDVCVSYYFHVTRRWEVVPENISGLRSFVRDERLGLPRIVSFMNLMAERLEVMDRAVTISYEEMHADARAVLRRVLEVMGDREPREPMIQCAVEECRFDRMQAMEREGRIDHDALQPGHVSDSDSFKMREGRVGAYRERLDQEDLAYMDQYVAANLDPRYAQYGG